MLVFQAKLVPMLSGNNFQKTIIVHICGIFLSSQDTVVDGIIIVMIMYKNGTL